MNGLSFKQKLLVGGVLAALLLTGIIGVNMHRSALNADKVYAAALDYLKNGDYSNAYYKFSKVSFLSNLKPDAINHEWQPASELRDKNAAIKNNQLFFNN